MTRDEFINSAQLISRQELIKIAEELRKKSGGRIPPEVEAEFRNLDVETSVEELYIETVFGKTHVFKVEKNDIEAKKLPVVINIHGGGWCLPHGERDIYFSRRIAKATACLVIDVDYVLAPEYPYPAAIEELEALIEVFPTFLEHYGGDSERLIICGQSSGANLAAAVMQRGRKTGSTKILCQILCYPPMDNYQNRFGDEQLSERDIATEYYGFFYNEKFSDRANSDVSPVYAKPEELRNIPQTHIITAGLDNLKQEAEDYAKLLKNAGVSVDYHCFENSKHGFAVNLYDEWQECEKYIVGLINNALGKQVHNRLA